MWLVRCKLAMWLDGLKDRIDSLAQRVGPNGYHGWEKWDAYAKRRGYHDWLLKD